MNSPEIQHVRIPEQSGSTLQQFRVLRAGFAEEMARWAGGVEAKRREKVGEADALNEGEKAGRADLALEKALQRTNVWTERAGRAWTLAGQVGRAEQLEQELQDKRARIVEKQKQERLSVEE